MVTALILFCTIHRFNQNQFWNFFLFFHFIFHFIFFFNNTLSNCSLKLSFILFILCYIKKRWPQKYLLKIKSILINFVSRQIFQILLFKYCTKKWRNKHAWKRLFVSYRMCLTSSLNGSNFIVSLFNIFKFKFLISSLISCFTLGRGLHTKSRIRAIFYTTAIFYFIAFFTSLEFIETRMRCNFLKLEILIFLNIFSFGEVIHATEFHLPLIFYFRFLLHFWKKCFKCKFRKKIGYMNHLQLLRG